jgi:hypothetical protein
VLALGDYFVVDEAVCLQIDAPGAETRGEGTPWIVRVATASEFLPFVTL